MTGTDMATQFSWRELPGGGRVENPCLRQPLCLIVDDPTPGYNPAYFHLGFRDGPARVPNSLLDAFADLVEQAGMKGKFSVVPYPFGLGRVDQGVQGLTGAELRYFLDVTRARIAPFMDITPEVLTHWNALDLATGGLLPYWEHVWSRAQDRHSLQPYLALALEILNEVDLPCSGMTSPWDFGADVEEEYAEALLAAQRAVNGRGLSWVFMAGDAVSPRVPPRLLLFRAEAREAVVSILCCDARDFGRETWTGGEADPDVLISADGQNGRLAEVLRGGGPAVFHTHWQTIIAGGRTVGLEALGEIARRLREHVGASTAWTRCSDLARYAAAAAGVGLEPRDGGYDVAAPFACAGFTLSLPAPAPLRTVRLDGRPLERASPGTLTEGSYAVAQDRLYLCWNLQDGQQIEIESIAA